jgi:hypothetical protein
MKKLLLLALLTVLFAHVANCQTPGTPRQIIFTLSEIDPITGSTAPTPKTPVVLPTVFICGHTLSFPTACAENIPFVITNTLGTIVCYSVLPTGTTSYLLPLTLSGTYTLYIYVDGCVFCGQIVI